MLDEARNQRGRNGVVLPAFVGGKTGTPERGRPWVWNNKRQKWIKVPDKTINDGWYMFFVEGDSDHTSIAVAVRMERLENQRTGAHKGSGAAVLLTEDILLGCLNRHGYIRNE